MNRPCPTRHKICTRCGKDKPWTEYHASKKWEDGTMRCPQSRCKACNAELNSDKCKAYWERLKQDPERHAIRKTQFREYRRQQDNIPPERYRFEKREAKRRAGVSLPSGPFGDWLRTLLREYDNDFTKLAVVVGLSTETVRRIMNNRVQTVDLGTVETALCAIGSRTIRDLYGDLG